MNNKIMKTLSAIFAIFILLHISYMAFLNQGQIISIVLFPKWALLTVSSGTFILLLSLYTALGALFLAYYDVLKLKAKIKKQARTVEKTSISSQENIDKTELLQSKIDTLEAALKEALSKK